MSTAPLDPSLIEEHISDPVTCRKQTVNRDSSSSMRGIVAFPYSENVMRQWSLTMSQRAMAVTELRTFAGLELGETATAQCRPSRIKKDTLTVKRKKQRLKNQVILMAMHRVKRNIWINLNNLTNISSEIIDLGDETCTLHSDDTCFYFGRNSVPYKHASQECLETGGGELASITNPRILHLLLEMVNKQNSSDDPNCFWINISHSTLISLNETFSIYFQSYNNCGSVVGENVQPQHTCYFAMAKHLNTKLILRQMKKQEKCTTVNMKVLCQGSPRGLADTKLINSNGPITTIIIATSVGMLASLLIVGLIIRSLRKSRINSHNRMENVSKSSSVEERKTEDRYIASDNDYDNDTKGNEFSDYAELDNDFKPDQSVTNSDIKNTKVDRDANDTDSGQDGVAGEEPCYFVLNKQTSEESLQHTYEACGFRDLPSTSSLPMTSNPLTLTLPTGAMRNADATDENVYDWPDLLQPSYSAKSRRTQSETEPQYFTLEIDNEDTENIYDSVFPIEKPLKKSPKTFRTKHLSLPRKKHKAKQHNQAKSRFISGGVTHK
ncbi:uncharacterized protein [Antedon mediterranea]|uniref:uncharacterized protein n=1 Tax=Antedon mediterranea TaxID=105859 RepID=UPI003AF9ED71